MFARLLLAVVVLSACASPVAAQCVDGNNVAGWPTTITFQPALPAAGEPVTAIVGVPISGGVANARSERSGAQIALRGTTASIDIGVPPPPSPKLIELGGLPRGTYTVTAQFTQDVGTASVPCAPVQAQLVVGGGGPVIESVPIVSHWLPVAALVGLLLIVAVRRVT